MWRHIGCLSATLAVMLATPGAQFGPAPTPWDPSRQPMWHLPEPTKGVPTAEGGDVFALTRDHHLLKVAAADGSLLWRVATGETSSTPGWATAVTPTQVLVGEYDLAAFDRVTGRRQWVFTPDNGHAPGPFLGDVRGDVAYTGSGSGHLFAVDTHTGTPRWQTAIDDSGRASVYWPRVAGTMVVAGYTRHDPIPNRGGLVGVNAADGRERWRFAFPPAETAATNLAGGPVVSGSLVLGASGDGRVWAVDTETGEVRFTLPPMSGPLDSIIPAGAEDFRSLAVSGRTLIVGSTTGYVLAYDLDDQRERWRFAGGRLGSTWLTMAATADIAFVPYAAGYLVALDVATGTLRWRTDDWQQGFLWAPAIAGGHAIAGSKQGLWALPLEVPR